MKVLLIAHNKEKSNLINLVNTNKSFFEKCELFATKQCAMTIVQKCHINVKSLKSGIEGGDIMAGSMIIKHQIDIMFFLKDETTVHAHNYDINALIRIATLYNVAFATNLTTSHILIDYFGRKI